MFRFVILLLGVVSLISGYKPETDNGYYLLSSENPSDSQTLVNGNASQVLTTNFDPLRKTAVIIHGWERNNSSVTSFITIVASALLASEDLNMIVVDWSAGANNSDYQVALDNAVKSGPVVAKFLSWLNYVTGANVSQYHLVGHGLGAHQAGLVGKNMGGQVPYLTGLDPAGPFEDDLNRLESNDSLYTEVIHTNAGELGYPLPLGHVDVYCNGGTNQPGCFGDATCDHERSYLYFAESIITGGFTAVKIASYNNATVGAKNCTLPLTLNVGGIYPKTGSSGIYYLKTNAKPPYAVS